MEIQSKQCNKCKQIKSIDLFCSKKGNRDGKNSICKECIKLKKNTLESRKSVNSHNLKIKDKIMLRNAKQRAKIYNLEINIEVEDIIIPDTCPVLGIPISNNGCHNNFNSPTLDRIDNTKGYVKGNVCVISRRANTIKSCGTIEEHKKVIEYMQKYIQSSPIQDNLSSKACMSRESPSTSISHSS
jgi:hypothetical protein